MTPASLLTRVLAATEGSRELDAEVHCAANGYPPPQVHRVIPVPPYTTDLSAAIALVERVRPGWTIANLQQQDDRTWWCELREGHLASYRRVAMSETVAGKRSPTPALALLAALLMSLEDEDAR